jgi:hypothetical protein
MEQDKKSKKFIKTTIREFLNENIENDYKVLSKGDNRGTIITPFFHNVYNNSEILEVNFSELYKGMFSFAKYGVIQFNIKSDNVEDAITLAKNRLNVIFKNGYPNKKDIVVVTGFRYDENNNKNTYNLSFMENTHNNNRFTENSYKTKKGDLLKYDQDGDGFGFWYVVDKNGKRLSERLKGGIFIGYLSDGVIQKY